MKIYSPLYFQIDQSIDPVKNMPVSYGNLIIERRPIVFAAGKTGHVRMQKKMKTFYERNDYLLNHEVNKTFEQILWMDDNQFRNWCIKLRKTVVYAWDELGIPPRVGYDEASMIDQFNQMESFPVHEFQEEDLLTGDKHCIRNTSVIGNAVNQFFPTMMKTRINYTSKDDGKSIYDFFAKDELLETFITYARRHFKRDSFYHYSRPVIKGDKENFLFHAETGEDWIRQFKEKEFRYDRSSFWLCPKKEDATYTGYNEDLKNQEYLIITEPQLNLLWQEHCIEDINISNALYIPNCNNFQIRYFEFGQKLFPVGLKAFRVSFCQYAVNFPPLTAKYLYERYTEHIKEQDKIYIYDPSAGWAGRLLGAMSVKDDRNIHYIGTDPNTDHSLPNHRTKYHEVADFYNTKTTRNSSLFPHINSYEIFQDGSEVIGLNPAFQKYKGKLDLVFTSPPYFAKEAYSEDPEQSYKKFSAYQDWVDGFLRPTLTTCVEYLRSGRYLLWNIADAKFGKDMLPLEKDSNDILESLGMKYICTQKMLLAQMPGGNRIDEETGEPRAKNFCKIWNANRTKQTWQKYEPIFVWRKP